MWLKDTIYIFNLLSVLTESEQVGFFLMLILCEFPNRKLSKALCKQNNPLVLLISISKQCFKLAGDTEEEEQVVDRYEAR